MCLKTRFGHYAKNKGGEKMQKRKILLGLLLAIAGGALVIRVLDAGLGHLLDEDMSGDWLDEDFADEDDGLEDKPFEDRISEGE